ncbi:hypothetical protein SHIRM173S_02058 [Streptomyces hirsutus]
MLGYGCIVVPVMLGLALVFALMLDSERVRLAPFTRLAIFLPYAIPGVIAALLWGFLYLPDVSPFYFVLDRFGLPQPDLLDGGPLFLALSNIAVWGGTGFNMIVIYTALRAVPAEVYEAAKLDGATPLAEDQDPDGRAVAGAASSRVREAVWTGFTENLSDLNAYRDGVYWKWMGNSALYAGLGALLSTCVSAVSGYALAVYRFRGRETLFNVLLTGVLMPPVILAVPQYLLLAQADLTDSYLSVLLPQILSPYGVYLARIYAAASVPSDVVEAGLRTPRPRAASARPHPIRQPMIASAPDWYGSCSPRWAARPGQRRSSRRNW